jgi:hypothetical protein
MPNKITNKTPRANAIRQIKAGLAKYFGSTALVLAGTSYKPAALQAFLQADVGANDASTQARASWLSAVKIAKSTDSATDPVLEAIEGLVKSQFGKTNVTVLTDFGYASAKPVTLTSAETVIKVAKAEATRAARGTMGPKAKAKIKGIVPSSSAKAPAPASPAPAPTGNGNGNGASNGSPSASPNAVTTNQSHA